MSSSHFGSSPSSGFDALDPRIQRWIHSQGWTSLHDAQERAIAPIVAGDRDVVITAATAAGKTEAAFLPICSVVAQSRTVPSRPDPWTVHDPWAEPAAVESTGVQVLYLSPLKALINDQFNRLDQICETVDIPVHRWHGDVASSAKQDLLRNPTGVLLITPESLEAMFVLRGTRVPSIFAGLRYVVIDEMHSFIASPRGAQLQSLLHRIDLALRRRSPRIGLSATIGDLTEAARFLRPENPEDVAVISSQSDGRELKLQLRGYIATSGAENDDRPAYQQQIADHLFNTLRGSDNLVFANARRDVETYADLLATRSEQERVANEFWPHHGNLSKEARETVEDMLKDTSRPATAICTSTLEMGIDIGTVASVAQVGPPPSVASLRQRLGRSGRRDEPAVVRIYATETELDSNSTLLDRLRCNVVQSVAMVRLMLDHWVESPDDPGFNYSTLIQQTLSTIAQHGGATPADLHRALCSPGPFEKVDSTRFVRLLKAMAAADLITQTSDGLLLPGVVGERHLNHYDFYTAFVTGDEWRLVADGRTLGTMPVFQPLFEGVMLIFGGKRWQVVAVDQRTRVVELVRAKGGKPPLFSGHAAMIGGEVRAEMVRVYSGDDRPAWLDPKAAQLLDEARAAWGQFSLATSSIVRSGRDIAVLPWAGDTALFTAALMLQLHGLDAQVEGPALVIPSDIETLRTVLAQVTATPAPDPLVLAELVRNKQVEKWDWVLDDQLACEATAARRIDIQGAIAVLTRAEHDLAKGELRTEQVPARRESELARQEFCVIDVETTGFSPRLGDRVIEIAAVRVRGDGTVIDEWSTLVNPVRDVGPTSVHGITASDVADAPMFADVLGDVLSRLDGAVMVAHNIRFDRDFLAAEFTRAGIPMPSLPGVCTLSLGGLLQPGTASSRLTECCSRLGIELADAHDALADARAAARVLCAYLAIAEQQGQRTLAAIGCVPLEWPTVPHIEPSNRTQARGGGSVRVQRQGDYLTRLVGQLDATTGADSDIAAYMGLLERALEDRRLSSDESDALAATARQWGLSPERVREVHNGYFLQLLAAAWADGAVTELERRDLVQVAALLSVSPELIDRAPVEHAKTAPARTLGGTETADSLVGKTVCFTGALLATIDGVPVTRDMAQQLAVEAGLVVKDGVSKGLDLLVVADPDSQSTKARRARELGTRVIAETVFWQLLNIAVD